MIKDLNDISKPRMSLEVMMSFSDVLELAESLGWVDPNLDARGGWTPAMVDATEESAIDFIEASAEAHKDG